VACCRVWSADRRDDLERPAGRVAQECGERGIALHSTVVPLAQGETYVRIPLAARLVTLPETGHFELIDPDSAAWPHVVAGLVRRLSDRTRPRGQP
jgi:hypothetical protein